MSVPQRPSVPVDVGRGSVQETPTLAPDQGSDVSPQAGLQGVVQESPAAGMQGAVPAQQDSPAPVSEQALQTGMALVQSPHIQSAMQAIQGAAKDFETQGAEAFRAPGVTQALGMAFEPLIAQSVGQPLGNGQVIGQATLADLVLTDRNTLRLKLVIQPVNEQTGEPGAPYEAWLTENRIPESQGGQPMELTREEVMQSIQGLSEIAALQQESPDQIDALRARPLHALMR